MTGAAGCPELDAAELGQAVANADGRQSSTIFLRRDGHDLQLMISTVCSN